MAVIGGQQEVFLHNVSFAEVVAPQVLCGQESDRLVCSVEIVKELHFYQAVNK